MLPINFGDGIEMMDFYETDPEIAIHALEIEAADHAVQSMMFNASDSRLVITLMGTQDDLPERSLTKSRT
jgi:hypothetical protein